jgi:hypothetical protein
LWRDKFSKFGMFANAADGTVPIVPSKTSDVRDVNPKKNN